MHLVEPTCEDDAKITISEALCHIRQHKLQTLASVEIQSSIKSKLGGYPQKTKDNLHRTNLFVPASIAVILKHKPNLIAPAVQAFCNRDPADIKACNAMKYFPPENRVKAQVSFTKCLYAMMTHSKYVPDRRTGWNLPPINSPQYRSNILGVKVACGFEILVSQAKPTADVNSDKGWLSFLNSLKDKGYFKGLLEHSVEYNNLLNKAEQYYVNHRDTIQYCPAVGQEILELLKHLDINNEELKKEEDNLPPEDDDKWLNISPEDLDKMLQEKYGQKKILTVNNNSNVVKFSEKISNFLNHVSDLDGAEFPDRNESPVRPPRRRNKSKVSFSQDTKEETKLPNNKINFDPNSFACAVQNILNFVIPEDDSWDLDSDSDMSEYEEDTYVKEQSYEGVKNKMQEYMQQMDRELAKTTIGESFEKKNGDTFDDIEDFTPVDIDVNALKNILESYRSQLGEAGPSSNMLGPMGIHLNAQSGTDIN